VPYLDPAAVAPTITRDDIDMRFETEYRPILAKQADVAFTRLRWFTGLHAFSDTIKALGLICAGPASRRVVQRYRDAMRTVRDLAPARPLLDDDAQSRAELARSLAHMLGPRAERSSGQAATDTFDLYCALDDSRTSLASDIRQVAVEHLETVRQSRRARDV